MNDEQYIEMMQQLASNETEHKSFRRRLEDHDSALKKYGDMLVIMERQSNAIENMGGTMGRVEKKVDSIDNRVAVLEKEPAEKWKKTTWEVLKYILLALVGVAVGYVLKTPAP